MSDLRLANHYSYYIRSMVTMNVCYAERPHNNPPSLGSSQPRPYRTLLPCNFQRVFTRINYKLLTLTLHLILYVKIIAISPTRTVNLCYTRISALHRKDSYLALPIVTIVCHDNNILAYSPLERLLPIPQDRSFNTHSNQYNVLKLTIFVSAPNLTNRTHDPLTSILASHFASFDVSQQFTKLLH